MKLDDIIDSVATETQISKSQVKRVAHKIFETIRTKVEAGEKVGISGMGSFLLQEREAGTRVGKDGETKEVSAARFVTFRPSRSATGKTKREKAASVPAS